MNYKITHTITPFLTIYNMDKGEKFYTYPNRCITTSPLYYPKEPNSSGYLKKSRYLGGILENDSTHTTSKHSTTESTDNPFSTFFSQFMDDVHQTLEQKKMSNDAGEASYIQFEALKNGQAVTLAPSPYCTILPWNATPLSETEKYTDFEENTFEKYHGESPSAPHGTIIAVCNSFLAAYCEVSSRIYHTGDLSVKNFSKTQDRFRMFSGNGMVFLESYGTLIENILEPGESIAVYPGCLLAFTKGTKLKMISAGSLFVRQEEQNDYLILLTAGKKGGIVYCQANEIESC